MDGGDMGGRGFGMGRKLASVDLQLLILGLLAEKPRHGYEIIKALDERSKGFYVPSPGMVYPALTYLEEIGHATVETEGARKLYHITEAGKEHLEEQSRHGGRAVCAIRAASASAWIACAARCTPRKPARATAEDRRDHERRGSSELHARHGAISKPRSPTNGTARARNNSDRRDLEARHRGNLGDA